MQKLYDCLNNEEYKSSILPFLWLHGESHERISEELDALERYGITEFCAESRPHPDFCGEQWWTDFGFILEEAKKRGMRVWLFDDCHFPTGHANFYIEKHTDLKRHHLRLEFRDIGTISGVGSLVMPTIDEYEKIIKVFAYKQGENFKDIFGEGIDLTDNIIDDGLLTFELQPGVWRICYLIDTINDCIINKCYFDVLNEKSTEAMITAVYEPHFEHFSEYFGNTFAGFFSDEPSFANFTNEEGYQGRPIKSKFIPYSTEVFEKMGDKLNLSLDEIWSRLPRFWLNHEDSEDLFIAYMQTVSDIYQRNVPKKLADWCHSHGVQYIGHVLEDMGSYQRIGYGAGNIFKALAPQDMAGMDLVLHQINPFYTEKCHHSPIASGFADPSFFNYTIGKLVSSIAHINPHMKNRALCEIFGAFGWAEGVPFMKQMADKMLASGINHFIPHAFTVKDDDPDCPPHFHSKGTFLQEESFKNLISYMQKTAYMLNGKHVSGVAIAHIPEGEWSNKEYLPIEQITKKLTQNQIDFDILPLDNISDFIFKDGKLFVNGEMFRVLIVPYNEYFDTTVLKTIEIISENIPVIFVNSESKTENSINYVALSNLKYELENIGVNGILLDKECPLLRVYHSVNDDKDIYFFHNDDVFNSIDTLVDLNCKKALFYDAWDNKVYNPKIYEGKISLHLKPGGSIIVVCGEEAEEKYPYYPCKNQLAIKCDWKITHKTDFDATPRTVSSEDLSMLFGIFNFEADIDISDNFDYLQLQNVGETASLYINGEFIGNRVGEEFCFPVKHIKFNGKTNIRVEVVSNAALKTKDFLSSWIAIEPTGCSNVIKLFSEENLG